MAPKAHPFADFGQRCRELRTRRKLSQIDVTKQSDFGLSHYQKIERGVLDARFSTLRKLAEVYGVSLSELLKGL
jgi:transcriptional regulator with XRE-family HTH domain